MKLDEKNKVWVTGNKPFKFIQFKNIRLVYPDQIFHYDYERVGICVNSWEEMWEVIDVLEKLKIPYLRKVTHIEDNKTVFFESSENLVYRSEANFEIDSIYNLSMILDELKKLGYKTSWEYRDWNIIA